MLNALAFANASTVVTAVFYLLLIFITVVAPDLIFSMAKAWFHSLNMDSLKAQTVITVERALIGLISICVLTWVTVYAMIWLYNLWR